MNMKKCMCCGKEKCDCEKNGKRNALKKRLDKIEMAEDKIEMQMENDD